MKSWMHQKPTNKYASVLQQEVPDFGHLKRFVHVVSWMALTPVTSPYSVSCRRRKHVPQETSLEVNHTEALKLLRGCDVACHAWEAGVTCTSVFQTAISLSGNPKLLSSYSSAVLITKKLLQHCAEMLVSTIPFQCFSSSSCWKAHELCSWSDTFELQ